jgi:putative spermidine/putrescine transport system ATP-binding protein
MFAPIRPRSLSVPLRRGTTGRMTASTGPAQPAIAERDGGGNPAVRVKGLRKNYGPVTALDGVDLDIRAGEFFTMLGPSGSGKTTLLRLIAGFERPDGGAIELGGRDISRVPPYARDVNTVFQDYALFPHMSVAQNIEYGLRVKRVSRSERRRRAERALEMVRLSGLGARKPTQLSGGQRQRVAIARAILKDPAILILDEATSSLDSESESLVQQALDSLMRGRTSVIIAHRLATIRRADCIFVIKEGQMVESGTHEQLAAREGGVYRTLSELQFGLEG